MFEKAHQRRPGPLVVLAILVLLFFSTFLFVAQAPVESSSSDVPTTKMMRYSFTLTNRTGEVIENVTFRAFAPVEATPYQRVDSIESNQPFEQRKDALGNQELEFRFESLPPYGQKVVNVSVQVSMWNSPRIDAISPELRQSGSAALVDETDRHVQAALAEIESPIHSVSPLAWLKAANSWVYQTFEDVGYVSRDRGALFALSEKKGDCTEFMHALVALSRTQQIPALPVAGFRIDGSSAVLKAMDYHNWVMFEADGKWGVADPHGNIFEEARDNYVAFRLLQAQAGQTENSQRFFTHDSRVKVAMN